MGGRAAIVRNHIYMMRPFDAATRRYCDSADRSIQSLDVEPILCTVNTRACQHAGCWPFSPTCRRSRLAFRVCYDGGPTYPPCGPGLQRAAGSEMALTIKSMVRLRRQGFTSADACQLSLLCITALCRCGLAKRCECRLCYTGKIKA